VTSQAEAAAERFDASGLLVMPGMVDSHVHFMDPGDPAREDFPSGTAAAARSGVTTVVEHTHARPVRTGRDLAEKGRHLSTRSRVDFALAAHAWPGEVDSALDAWRAGAAFLKVFTCTTHGIPAHDAEQLRALLGPGAEAGAVFLAHCEDEALTAAAERTLRSRGRHDGGIISAWRNLDAELTAVGMVAAITRETGARVVIAHASCAATVGGARGAGSSTLSVETCPQYLTLMRFEADRLGALRKFTPPARAERPDDLDAMWTLVREGQVDLVSSDHAPSTLAQKLGPDLWDAHFGLPGIDTTMGILLDGAARGLISYERLVEVYSERPATLYGLAPRKGVLAPGADADLVLVDPQERWTVSDSEVLSRAGWSPYAGRELTGRAVRTYLRGELVMEGGRVIAEPGQGRLLRGAGASS
jgi:dihydroorotase (multifunctional complex type)